MRVRGGSRSWIHPGPQASSTAQTESTQSTLGEFCWPWSVLGTLPTRELWFGLVSFVFVLTTPFTSTLPPCPTNSAKAITPKERVMTSNSLLTPSDALGDQHGIASIVEPTPPPPVTPRRPRHASYVSVERSSIGFLVKLPIPTRAKDRRAGRDTSRVAAQGEACDQFFARELSEQEKRAGNRSVFSNDSEPETVAKYLFWYGFVFPLFWILGVIILTMPLCKPDPEAGDRSPASNAQDLALLRATERKWGLRCLYALVSLLIVVAVIIIVLWAARVGVFKNRS